MNDSVKKTTRNQLPAGPGRPKGVPNKTTQVAKDAIAQAAAALGGAVRLTEWAQSDPKNEHAFWTTIYPKLLPLQVANADGEEFKTVSRIELIAPHVLGKA